PDIPIYMSQGSKELIEISDIFVPTKVGNLNAKVIDLRKALVIGSFKVRPFLVDHSAFDALAYQVEADGKKIFYTGDFRAHGRKRILFDRIIKNPPKNIDCLLMEGSMLGRSETLSHNEEYVQKDFEILLKQTDNIVFLSASSQNIDRLVSAYKACINTGRILVLDVYTAFILDRLRKISKGIPQFNWKNVRVKFMKYHNECLVKAGLKELLFKYAKSKIEMHEINQERKKILMLLRDNSVFDRIIEHIPAVKGAKLIFSMWEEYLKDEFKQKCANYGIEIVHLHTSGHAFPQDLKKFVQALKPKKLVPIHTFFPNDYQQFGKMVEMVPDEQPLII
ncbi:MAG: MBL fold metallo-hydrolase RNA specificity domain-containing protein, partial [Candidatus Margulisiibacteriota bacterium]